MLLNNKVTFYSKHGDYLGRVSILLSFDIDINMKLKKDNSIIEIDIVSGRIFNL